MLVLVPSWEAIACPVRTFVIKTVCSEHIGVQIWVPDFGLVMAAQSIANIIKSSLGPLGLDKMLVDNIGVRLHLALITRSQC